MDRSRYLVCYDIADKKRLYRIRRRLQDHAIDGQKSCYECLLSPSELAMLEHDLKSIIVTDEDRIHLFQLDPRLKPGCFGTASYQPSSLFLVI